jgi:integrase/recombinase XerD
MEVQIESYIDSLIALNMAKKSIASYYQHLNLFERYCKEQGKHDFKELTLEDLREYHKYLMTLPGKRGAKEMSPETIHLKMRVVKVFFEYLEKQGVLLVNPAERLDLPDLKDRLPKDILSEKEIMDILSLPNLNTVLGLRNKALLELLYSTALRRSECAGLKVLDVDTDGGYVRVNQGKGRKDRVVPLGKQACDAVKEYKLKARPVLAEGVETDCLFMGLYKKPMDGNAINSIVQRYGKKAKIKTPVCVHTFRRTAATHMLRGNANPLYIQRLLGHSTGWTLRKYVKVSAKDIKDAHEKTHPQERGK